MAIDYLPFAADPGADVVDQATFAAGVWRTDGFQPGIAHQDQANKVWRQSSMMTAALAQYLSTQNGDVDVLDDGDLNALIALIATGISNGAGVRAARVVTASANMDVLLGDYRVAFNRTAGLAALNAQLPDAQVGQEFVVVDIFGNFSTFPVTVLPFAGTTIANDANYVMNVDKMWARFARVSPLLWSLEVGP